MANTRWRAAGLVTHAAWPVVVAILPAGWRDGGMAGWRDGQERVEEEGGSGGGRTVQCHGVFEDREGPSMGGSEEQRSVHMATTADNILRTRISLRLPPGTHALTHSSTQALKH